MKKQRQATELPLNYYAKPIYESLILPKLKEKGAKKTRRTGDKSP